ncbi:MAG: MarR family winged helix-turn-helix transcriptional regulator [Pigmentiphaga sp.]
MTPDPDLPFADLPPAGRPTRPVRAPGLGFLTARLTRQIVWRLASKTADYGVMPAQFPVLRMVYRLQISTQAELARLCGIEQPSMAATLNRMEKAELIRRVVDEGDGRRRLVSLTPHGEDMLHRMTRDAHDVYDEAVEGLSESEIEQFLALCVRMTDNLERQRYGKTEEAGGAEEPLGSTPFA